MLGLTLTLYNIKLVITNKYLIKNKKKIYMSVVQCVLLYFVSSFDLFGYSHAV